MLKNYILIAYRGLLKNRRSSFINISGLAVGMAVAMMIGLWIYDELSFDRYNKHYDQVAQVMQHQSYNGEIHTDKAIPVPLGGELRQAYGSDFKHVVLSSWTNSHLLAAGEKSISQQGNFMEPGAAEIMSLQMVSGTAGKLNDANAILLSQSVAKALFGDASAIGKMIRLDSTPLVVSGVYQDLPDNATFNNISFIAPWTLYANDPEVKGAATQWTQNAFQLFVQLADGRSMADVAARIKDIKLRALGTSGAELHPVVFLQPMRHWHLHATFKNGVNTGGSMQYIWMFGAIGLFVLLLACINFMNLSTARSERRAKEVGIRKAMGSMRMQLVVQFYLESLIVASFAFILCMILVQGTLPFFNTIAGKKMTMPWESPLFWAMGGGFTLFTALVAGSYPALFLSAFKPVKVLKGGLTTGKTAALPRKILVTIQFTISIVLIIGTVIVHRQIRFAKDRPMGYNSNGLLLIRPYSMDYHDHFKALQYDLLQTGVVFGVAESSSAITKNSRSSGGLNWNGKDPQMQDEFTTVGVTSDYGNTVGWQLVAGRDFSSQLITDSNAVVINEAAVKYMGLQHPVGETIFWGKPYTIIGVVKNVVMTSPYEPVKQALYYITPEAGYLNIKISPRASASAALGSIEAVYRKYTPTAPFDYKFADAEYARKFGDEQRIGNLASVFAMLTIFISCLGLFGLASFIAEQRTREISIRKVLGASVYSLWQLQSKEFAVLVAISLLIAAPVAYYFTYTWLQNYQYHTTLSWWIFAGAGAGLLVITLVTVSFQSIKAALANPAKSLRAS